jgi:hypothetical protein
MWIDHPPEPMRESRARAELIVLRYRDRYAPKGSEVYGHPTIIAHLGVKDEP